MNNIAKLVVSLAIPFTAAGVGGAVTGTSVTTWYATLNKPPFNPPSWLFGPVWTLLYLLMGISLFLVWQAPNAGTKRWAFWAFGAQMALNVLWSVVFFGLHAPTAAAVVIVVLLAAIIVTAKTFWSISRAAVYLLLPYLAWVGFATVLNVGIALLN